MEVHSALILKQKGLLTAYNYFKPPKHSKCLLIVVPLGSHHQLPNFERPQYIKYQLSKSPQLSR